VDLRDERVPPTRAERERFAALLQEAVGKGILSLEEFESRLDAVCRARTLGELEHLVRWIPAPAGRPKPIRPRVIVTAVCVVLATVVGAAAVVGLSHGSGKQTPVGDGAGAARTVGMHPHNDAPKRDGAPTPSNEGDCARVASTHTPGPELTTATSAPPQPQVPFEELENENLLHRYRFPAPTDVAARARAAGLQLSKPSDGYHIHVHLDVSFGGGQIEVPAGIGVDPSGKVSPIHTHSNNGVIHVEADSYQPYTLGQFFTQWGQPLGNDSIGRIRALPGRRLYWFVNGTPVDHPAAVVLQSHDKIQAFEDISGGVINPTRCFEWPPGY
jgi:hypothetical protein